MHVTAQSWFCQNNNNAIHDKNQTQAVVDQGHMEKGDRIDTIRTRGSQSYHHLRAESILASTLICILCNLGAEGGGGGSGVAGVGRDSV